MQTVRSVDPPSPCGLMMCRGKPGNADCEKRLTSAYLTNAGNGRNGFPQFRPRNKNVGKFCWKSFRPFLLFPVLRVLFFRLSCRRSSVTKFGPRLKQSFPVRRR
jgi:hypothetical protein